MVTKALGEMELMAMTQMGLDLAHQDASPGANWSL
jgi:hypothetical protein